MAPRRCQSILRRRGHELESLLEPAAAFTQLVGEERAPALRAGTTAVECSPAQQEDLDVVVVGAGQCGLSVGYFLARMGVRFVILDASLRIGDSWRNRWDSLRLFTPARFDSLAGMPFPAGPYHFPTKDEMADYLETYARKFDLPVRSGVKVSEVIRDGERYRVTAGPLRYRARHVVVAAASYQKPRKPTFADELDPAIFQIHSSEYQNPAQLKPGRALLVGAGNSGAEIAIDLARTHEVSLAGRHPGHIPFVYNSFLATRSRHACVVPGCLPSSPFRRHAVRPQGQAFVSRRGPASYSGQAKGSCCRGRSWRRREWRA